MNTEAELYLQRAENELIAAEILFNISNDSKLQTEQFKLEHHFTFYNAVINHAYYCIFYSAKAILLIDGIKTIAPSVHQKTLDAFEQNLVLTGKLDVELLKMYKSIVLKAEVLLDIFSDEKEKRGKFTYQKLPHANKEPAKQSFDNASLFFKNINKIVRKSYK